jgi:hypothetical protein
MLNPKCIVALRYVFMLLVTITALAARARATDPCDLSAIPEEVQTILQSSYHDWQPERVEHLYDDDRQFWIKAHPNDCPGIAIGHFESNTQLSYALLLISKPDRKRPGLRILVFSRAGATAPYVSHLLSKWNIGLFYEGSDQVIATVPPGVYKEAIGPHKAQIDLDGLWYETMEKGAMLYYWKGGRYHELVTSD